MAKQIQESCITCGRCERGCPMRCIYPGAVHYEIDLSRCVNCGKCARYCPVGAIQDIAEEDKGEAI